jgi:dTDP-4-dehydrorhamnose 3,5-epimerase-like enzyme
MRVVFCAQHLVLGGGRSTRPVSYRGAVQHLRNVSFNHARGTVRGMHDQAAPAAESKLVQCTMGALYDVVIDLRLGRPPTGGKPNTDTGGEFKSEFATSINTHVTRGNKPG